jgi:hypothetical protein
MCVVKYEGESKMADLKLSQNAINFLTKAGIKPADVEKDKGLVQYLNTGLSLNVGVDLAKRVIGGEEILSSDSVWQVLRGCEEIRKVDISLKKAKVPVKTSGFGKSTTPVSKYVFSTLIRTGKLVSMSSSSGSGVKVVEVKGEVKFD